MLNFTLKYIKQKLKRERKIAMKGAKSRQKLEHGGIVQKLWHIILLVPVLSLAQCCSWSMTECQSWTVFNKMLQLLPTLAAPIHSWGDLGSAWHHRDWAGLYSWALTMKLLAWLARIAKAGILSPDHCLGAHCPLSLVEK